jgi:hypothetical protein
MQVNTGSEWRACSAQGPAHLLGASLSVSTAGAGASLSSGGCCCCACKDASAVLCCSGCCCCCCGAGVAAQVNGVPMPTNVTGAAEVCSGRRDMQAATCAATSSHGVEATAAHVLQFVWCCSESLLRTGFGYEVVPERCNKVCATGYNPLLHCMQHVAGQLAVCRLTATFSSFSMVDLACCS